MSVVYAHTQQSDLCSEMSCFFFVFFFRKVPEAETHWFSVALWHLMAVETWSGYPLVTTHFSAVIIPRMLAMIDCCFLSSNPFLCFDISSYTRGLMSLCIKRSDQVSHVFLLLFDCFCRIRILLIVSYLLCFKNKGSKILCLLMTPLLSMN